MYVMALTQFTDVKKNVTRKPGDEFIVSKERFEEINEAAKRYGLEALVTEVQKEPLSPEGKKAAKRARKEG